MPHTIDLGLLALATSESESTHVASGSHIASECSNTLPHCGPSARTPPPNLAVYPTPPAIRTQPTARSAGPLALMGMDYHNQEGEPNLFPRPTFLRSTFFGAHFRRRAFNTGRLQVESNHVRPSTFRRAVRHAFVLPQPHSPNLQPTMVLPRSSQHGITETGQRINTPGMVAEQLAPAHAVARIGCASMLALLSSLGRRESA